MAFAVRERLTASERDTSNIFYVRRAAPQPPATPTFVCTPALASSPGPAPASPLMTPPHLLLLSTHPSHRSK